MEPNIALNPEANQIPIQQTPPQPVQSFEPKKSLPKLPLIIAGVILIVVLLIGTYVLGKNQGTSQKTAKALIQTTTPTPTSTPDETKDWKTYSNDSVGYSFKYPSDWYLYPSQKSSDLDFQTVSPASYSTRDIDGVPAGMYINVWVADSKNLSLEDWAKERLQIPIKLTDKSVGGAIWKMTTDYPFYIGGEAFIIKQANKIFLVSLTKAGLDKQGGLKISDATFEILISTFKFTGETSQNSQAEQKYLDIPEFGVKLPLSENISDAYYVTSPKYTNFVYLKVHSLDNEPQCKSDNSSTAALTRVGKDEINQMDNKKYSERYNGTTIGNYFYFIDLAQYVCAESSKGITKLDSIRKAFQDASQTIESL